MGAVGGSGGEGWPEPRPGGRCRELGAGRRHRWDVGAGGERTPRCRTELKVQTRTGVCVSWIPQQHWRWGEAVREGQEAGGRPETPGTSRVRPVWGGG